MKLFYEKYLKLAHIGKGANAHVYKVRHAELGYVRAIKILNEYIESKGERAYQSFLKECKTLLAIGNGSHPNIVRIYGPDLIDNRAIVEMDYVQGKTLDSYIKQQGFINYEEVKIFIQDIVGALAYTHHDIYKFLMNPEEDDLKLNPNDGSKYLISDEKEKWLVQKYGIAHNDLHSNNVMRREYDGRFVLLDFGLAVQDGECVKSSRKSDGSPEYKAPEKFDSGEITPRSDVYSLGVLIYEVLTGRPPFVLDVGLDGKASYPSLDKICKEHHTLTPPPILPLRKAAFEAWIPGAVYERDYPEWLDDVVMKCLSKNPEERYSDAKELFDTINSNLINDDSDNKLIEALKDTITQLDKQCQDEKARNNKLSEDCRKTEQNNERLLKQLEASKSDTNKIQRLNDTITKITEQYLDEKNQKEQLILQIDKISNEPGTIDRKIWKTICIAIAGILLCGIIGVWLYKDSQVKSMSRDLVNTLHFAESLGMDSDEIKQMLDSLHNANIENGVFQTQITYNRPIIDSLQTVIDDLKNNSSVEISKLKKENKDLSQQIKTFESRRIYPVRPVPKIEYRTSPEVQNELNRLRSENKKLKDKLEGILESID